MEHDLSSFDFFMDEDIRSKRIGILCVQKTLTPALTQALFRVKENAYDFHNKRIISLKLDYRNGVEELRSSHKQIREIKWSSLNMMRSYIAIQFLEQFFHYAKKGPLPIVFIDAPFVNNHTESIRNFFDILRCEQIPELNRLYQSSSMLFVDSFTTPRGYRFEEKVRDENNLDRCFRIDSRAHDLMQLTDLLLGLSVYTNQQKKTSSKAKLRVLDSFTNFSKHSFNPVYYFDTKKVVG